MRAYEGGGQGQGEEGMRVAQATRTHHSSRVPQLGSARYTTRSRLTGLHVRVRVSVRTVPAVEVALHKNGLLNTPWLAALRQHGD